MGTGITELVLFESIGDYICKVTSGRIAALQHKPKI